MTDMSQSEHSVVLLSGTVEAMRNVLQSVRDGGAIEMLDTVIERLDHAYEARDKRWDHGMTGWRARVTYGRDGASQEGEITGYEHPGMVFLVMDGEEDPIKVNWCDMRPA